MNDFEGVLGAMTDEMHLNHYQVPLLFKQRIFWCSIRFWNKLLKKLLFGKFNLKSIMVNSPVYTYYLQTFPMQDLKCRKYQVVYLAESGTHREVLQPTQNV